jgi:glycosyltransferase involved in cell wall biosynthesis
MAAKVERCDQGYFEAVVEPLLGPGVEFIGEITEREKGAFLGDAAALLFPIDWPEPFGLVMIEAMACGTPVVAFPCGSVPEIVEHGVTGFITDSEEAAVQALQRVGDFDRHACRRRFEERFSAARMARDYLSLYKRLASRGEGRAAIAA